jgi:hypothetical protein
MRARFVGDWHGQYYGIPVVPGAVVDVPASLEWRIERNPHMFEVIDAPKRRGRPAKVRDGDEG